MKKYVFTFLSFFFLISVNAQFGVWKKKVDEIPIIKERILLIPSGDYGEGEFYANLRANLKKVIESEWTFSKSFQFVSSDEYRKLIDDVSINQKYAVLKYNSYNIAGIAPAGCLTIGLAENKSITHYMKIVNIDAGDRVGELNYGNNPVYIDDDLSLGDLFFAIQRLQYDLNTSYDAQDKKKELSKLFSPIQPDLIKDKTLLIDKDLLAKKFKDKISELYKYKFEIVTKEDIDNAIINKRPNVVYIRDITNVSIPLTRTSSSDVSRSTDKSGALSGPFNSYISLGPSLFLYGLFSTDNDAPLYFTKPKPSKKGINAKDIKGMVKN